MPQRLAPLCLAFVCFSVACSKESSTTTPTTPTPPPPAPSYTISDLVAQNVGNEFTCGIGSRSNSVVIDEISFRYQNPAGRNLIGTKVYRTAGPGTFLGTVGACTPDPCSAPYEQNPPAANTACIVEGTATSTAGRIQLFTKRDFLPTMDYEVRIVDGLPGDASTIVSNALTASIIRLPGAQNDRAAFYSSSVRQPVRGNNYSGGTNVVFYRPPPNGSPRRFEALFSYYHMDGRLFASNLVALLGSGPRLFGITDSVVTNGPPPWRVVIKLRETSTAPPASDEWVTCNSDRPYTGQAHCAAGADQFPATSGRVLVEDARELITPGL